MRYTWHRLGCTYMIYMSVHISSLFITRTWSTILCYQYCLDVYNFVLACTALVICMYFAIVQEYAFLYVLSSDRYIPPKNGKGRWSAFLSWQWKIRVTSLSQYHSRCNMKRVWVDERQGMTLLTFTIGDLALSCCAANRSNGLLKPAHQKRQEDTTDEFRLERNSCLILNFSTCVPSVTNIVKQNLIQEQSASLTASSTPLISILLG